MLVHNPHLFAFQKNAIGAIKCPMIKEEMSIQEFECTQQRKEAVHFKTGSRADGLVPVDINPTMSPDYDAMWILPSIFDVNIGHKKGFYLQCERDVPTHVTVRAVPQIPDHGCLTTVRANRYLNAESLLKSAGNLSEILFSNDAKNTFMAQSVAWNMMGKVMIFCVLLRAERHLRTYVGLQRDVNQSLGWNTYHMNAFASSVEYWSQSHISIAMTIKRKYFFVNHFRFKRLYYSNRYLSGCDRLQLCSSML